jgi:uncharacterized protein YbjT (DUF2867 family)
MSRRAPLAGDPALEWAQGDLATGAGLEAALAGADVVIHAASSPFSRTWRIDVAGTRRLLEAAHAAGVAHFVYISIVGIERVPFHYYRAKAAAEDLVSASGLPWSILRATQFHPFVDLLLRGANRLPLFPLPADFQVQPLDVGEAADRLAACVEEGPAGRLADIGGPEVLTLGEMAKDWMAARGQRRRVLHLPLPGSFAAAVRQGGLACPDGRYGRITWAGWLRRTYARQEASAVS